MIYFAHRGASALQVQNTLAAFALARKLGATRYELDVHLTRDGELAVHHDYTLRTPDGREAEIGALSYAQAAACPLENHFDSAVARVPRLADVLPVVRPELQLLNVEIKNDGNRYPGIEAVVLRQLQQADLLEKTLFSSFDYDTLLRLRALDKKARIGLLTRNFDLSAALRLGAESVHLNYTRFTPAIARTCHENGLHVYLYTVNEPELAARLQQAGADGIFTDRTDLFVQPA